MSLRGRSYDDANKRVRTALVVLMAGVVVLLAALGMALLRGPMSASRPMVRDERVEPGQVDEETASQVGVVLMVVGGVLVVTLLVAGYSLMRVMRRFAVPQQSKPFQPTATDDVWQKHKLAEGSPGEPEDGED
jgi:flagellar basal body-associated protein FliL